MAKRKPRGARLRAYWSKREKDIVFDCDPMIGGGSDRRILYHFFGYLTSDGASLIGELKARGYDITTLRFSVELPLGSPRTPSWNGGGSGVVGRIAQWGGIKR